MLFFTIIYNNEKEDIMDYLSDMKEYFEQKSIFLGISESINSGFNFVKIFCNDADFNSKLRNRFHLYIANILYKVVIKEYYEDEMYHYLTDTYFFLRYDEMKEVANRSFRILNDEEKITDEDIVYCMNKKNDIIDKIKACIEENNELNVQGFVTFRVKELRGDLEDIVNKVVEKYMAEKEYNEFIKLLKYFVEVQESKIDEINLAIKEDGSYSIQDKKGNDIMNEILNDLSDAKYIGTVGVEDLIISGLITYCPEKIIIHCESNCRNKELIDTIKKVFESRVKVCNECEICMEIKNTIKV
ncbi:putative sporulation protein YtxC [Clostridium bovifaecis]|uniref:Putative sporulation protein YtxC n=1 Tax=Clostridium bovifaecis TaxID=2184719 RepID=A0A6I6ERY0_9CLOT|nr:putative sporulation protein YtxC [Clostridium bovifaecis]